MPKIDFNAPVPFLPGVSVADYLRAAMAARGCSGRQARARLREAISRLGISDAFVGGCVGDRWTRAARARFARLEIFCLGPER